jgi:hypothetical protein
VPMASGPSFQKTNRSTHGVLGTRGRLRLIAGGCALKVREVMPERCLRHGCGLRPTDLHPGNRTPDRRASAAGTCRCRLASLNAYRCARGETAPMSAAIIRTHQCRCERLQRESGRDQAPLHSRDCVGALSQRLLMVAQAPPMVVISKAKNAPVLKMQVVSGLTKSSKGRRVAMGCARSSLARVKSVMWNASRPPPDDGLRSSKAVATKPLPSSRLIVAASSDDATSPRFPLAASITATRYGVEEGVSMDAGAPHASGLHSTTRPS